MKKLLLAALFAASALASQAASFKWDTSGKAYSIDVDTITTGLAAGKTYSVGSNNASSMQNQISSFNATWTYVMTLTAGTATDTLNGTLGIDDFGSRYIYKSGLSSTIWDSGTSESPIDVNYSIVLTGKLTDGTGASWTITSDAITGSQTYAGIGDIKITTSGASQWSTVPEPTSGLLMLVGLAGLALRRKRA